MPIDHLVVDGVVYLGAHRDTRRARELRANPRVAVHLESATCVITPTTAFGVAGAEPYGATRWRFMA